MLGSDPSRPPLSCRTSPPQGGRLAVLLSPQVGEMSGRTEGGAVPPASKVRYRNSAPTGP
ncbi:MAG: hypothetical protein E5Y81_04595 [Mesorhizobium sp.]|nr:MAG: hypothetical protein E5Y81_04595 [Mesorhizobium sp.]